MDTFNFSFFEDKPQEPSSSEHNGTAPDAPAPDAFASSGDALDLGDFGFLDEPIAGDAAHGEASPVTSETVASARQPHELSLEAQEPEREFANPFDVPEELPDIAIAPSDLEETSAFAPLDGDAPSSEPPGESGDSSFVLSDDDPLAFGGFSSASEEPPAAPSTNTLSESAATSSDAHPTDPTAPLAAATALAAGGAALGGAALGAAVASEAPTVPTPEVSEAALAAPLAKAKPPRFLTAEDPFGEVAPRREKLRVAILGASGIGFNHARWLAKHGGEIVGFLGSSDESVEATGERLESLLGTAPQGFSDLDQLLLKTIPQAVCIASPPSLHFSQAMACLDVGAHVLCEKPLVYAANRKPRENRDGARELVKAATQKRLVLATQLQYGVATPILCRLAGLSPYEVGDFAMELETTNPNSPADPRELWIDLGPHPISVAQFLGGEGAQLLADTIQVTAQQSASGTEVGVRFGVACEDGRLLMCRAIVRRLSPGARTPRRRFSFNGRIVQYTGVKAPDRSYLAQYTAPDGYISHYPDPVDFLVGNFVRTCWGDDALVLSAAQGAQNLDWLLSIGDKVAV